MKTQIYANILYFLLRCLALLPLRFLYSTLGVLLYWILRLIHYRYAVIGDNLKLIFPTWTAAQIQKKRKEYYRNMADLIVEIVKMTRLSLPDLGRLMHFKGVEHVEKAIKENKKIIFITGHYGNWEWMVTVPTLFGIPGYAIYQPLKNQVWNKIIFRLRNKFGVLPIETQDVVRKLFADAKNPSSSAYCILIDQSPAKEHPYYTNFLGQEVPFNQGLESIIRKFNMAPFYTVFRIPKPGFYEVEFVPLVYNAEKTQDYPIIEQYKKLLEQDIYRHPELWLLSHKRFKHRLKHTSPSQST